MTQKNVQRLVGAYTRVEAALKDEGPRAAAQIICEEFTQLLDQESFWQGFGTVVPKINQFQQEGQQILSSLPTLLDYETKVLGQLEVRDAAATLVLRDVFGALGGAINAHQNNAQTLNDLLHLRENLGKATTLICRASRSRFQRARDFLVSWKGARVLGGCTVVAANVVAFTVDGGAFSWASVQAGAVIMSGNVIDLIDILSKDD